MNSSVSKAYAKMRRFCDRDPAMRSRIEEMMDLVENAGDGLRTADEAEERIIEFSRQLNAQMLSSWCQRREQQLSESRKVDLELCGAGRKNCGGTPRSG